MESRAEIGGRMWRIVYTVNSMCQMEEIAGGAITDVFRGEYRAARLTVSRRSSTSTTTPLTVCSSPSSTAESFCPARSRSSSHFSGLGIASASFCKRGGRQAIALLKHSIFKSCMFITCLIIWL